MKYNVLYIHSHDTGRYVSPYGYLLPTPNIERLAGESAVFRNAHNAAPTCSPSRAALLTGQAPHSCGQFGLVNRGFELRDRQKHIAGFLAGLGYDTVLAGTQHVASDPATCGYTEILPKSKTDGAVAISAADFLTHRSRDKPFFLDVGFSSTHREFPKLSEPGPKKDLFVPRPYPDVEPIRRDMAEYRESVRIYDECVGTVLDALDSAGLWESTIVVCTTDHGIAFPFMKCNLTQHGTGVMLIVGGPKEAGFSGYRSIDALVSQIDVFPTLCEGLDLSPPDWLQGRSLMGLIRGEQNEINDEIYADVSFHVVYEPMRSVRTHRHNYIRRFYEYPHPVLCNCDDGYTKTYLAEHGLASLEIAREELYDLLFDPNEVNNLADKPEHQSTLKDMRKRLKTWMRETEDPLLDGDIAVPDRAILSELDDYSPRDVWQRVERPDGFG